MIRRILNIMGLALHRDYAEALGQHNAARCHAATLAAQADDQRKRANDLQARLEQSADTVVQQKMTIRSMQHRIVELASGKPPFGVSCSVNPPVAHPSKPVRGRRQ